jgi:hypothetical protein
VAPPASVAGGQRPAGYVPASIRIAHAATAYSGVHRDNDVGAESSHPAGRPRPVRFNVDYMELYHLTRSRRGRNDKAVRQLSAGGFAPMTTIPDNDSGRPTSGVGKSGTPMTTVHPRDLAHWPEGADFDSVAWQANGANAGPRGVDHGTLDISYG